MCQWLAAFDYNREVAPRLQAEHSEAAEPSALLSRKDNCVGGRASPGYIRKFPASLRSPPGAEYAGLVREKPFSSQFAPVGKR